MGSIMETYNEIHPSLQVVILFENKSTQVECASDYLQASFSGVKGILQPSPSKTKWKAPLKFWKSNLEMHYSGNSGPLINLMFPLHLLPDEWAIHCLIVQSLPLWVATKEKAFAWTQFPTGGKQHRLTEFFRASCQIRDKRNDFFLEFTEQMMKTLLKCCQGAAVLEEMASWQLLVPSFLPMFNFSQRGRALIRFLGQLALYLWPYQGCRISNHRLR